MVTITKQSLLYSENLTLPSFQVIVMTANMECARCQEKVSQIISKMTGLKEYVVDVPNKRVAVIADFVLHKKVKDDSTGSRMKFFGCFSYASQFFINVSEQLVSAIFWRIKQKSVRSLR